ncbi:unnamed protein product [Oncorhynchus mykiss]|uniref:Synaptopodin 2-like protein n=1 Tax=Oncorhynchus mykiss TaxID=8022 RepID=A0A060VXS3_ONCMY|nr:unnamed protein product [Oncorhynchus mykiss]
MTIIDSSPGILHIQSVVLLTRAPSPRIDKEYRATLRAMSPSSRLHHTATVMEVPHGRSSLLSPMVRRCLTSPPGSEAYYGETDSDAEVAANERQRRQKHRNPSNLSGKAFGRASPEGGETSEFSGYDSAPDARVIYQPPPGMWSSQTSTETSSIISSAEDQVSGQDRRAKEAMQLSSRRQMVPMVGPIDTPLDEELSVTYMDKAKQAKLNRGDTVQDKKVKEARTKCRSIASLLTDAPNPNSKGVLMFKKRRQRSKKYTLTSFGSVDEDMQHNSPEEDGLFPGSESEFDEDGFSAAPDTTWDSDYLDALEKRATAGGERGDGAEDAPSPGLSDISGKGAQLFEQQRKRAAEHAKKEEARSVLNRTARPFNPGFVTNRAATAPVVFRPVVTKSAPRPATSVSIVGPPFSTSSEPPPTSALATHPRPAFSVENLAEPPMPSVPQASFTAIPPPPAQFSGAPIPQAPVSVAQSAPAPVSFDPIHQPQVSVAQMPQASVSARRCSGRRPMFRVPAEKKNSPNPDLLNMVQNLDDRPRYRRYSESVMGFESGAEEDQGAEVCRGRMPPLVAPKPRVIHEAPQIPQEEGKGAQLFARRQSRMDRHVVDTPQETAYRQEVSHPGVGPQDAPNLDMNSQWKLSPNIRAPPPIGYNPLLAPSCPVGPQRDTSRSARGDWGGKGGIAFQREGIKALDFMRRQPYQLNSAMFGGTVGDSLLPRPEAAAGRVHYYVKAARVYEIKRFSTPTPMSAPSLAPTVIAPRSATTLGERLTRSDMISPTPAPLSPPPAPFFAPAPVSASPSAPKPRFIATKVGVQPCVWRPGAM